VVADVSCHYYSARALSAAGYRPADPLLSPGCPSIPGTPNMDPQGSKVKEDPEYYRTSHRIKRIIKLFAFYYTLEWINIKISEADSIY
jgi:hypothetical protein